MRVQNFTKYVTYYMFLLQNPKIFLDKMRFILVEMHLLGKIHFFLGELHFVGYNSLHSQIQKFCLGEMHSVQNFFGEGFLR